MNAITSPPMTMAPSKAAKGERISSNGDGALRASRSMRIRRVHNICSRAAHEQADFLARGGARVARLRHRTMMDHGDAVGDFEQLVEVLADDQHRRALA